MNMMMIAIGGIAVVGALPYALPSAVTIEREAILEADRSQVFDLLASNEGFQTFNPYLDDDPQLAITLSGPSHGVGSAFAFEGKDGKGTTPIAARGQGDDNRTAYWCPRCQA